MMMNILSYFSIFASIAIGSFLIGHAFGGDVGVGVFCISCGVVAAIMTAGGGARDT